MKNIIGDYKACKVCILVGVVAYIAGITSDGFDLGDLRALGAIVFIGAIARLAIKPAIKPQSESYQAGWEDGYDVGHHDGHNKARPVVVPMIRIPADISKVHHN